MPRAYGQRPYRAVVVHGGPGAAGSAAGLARGMAAFASVLEPFQSADSVNGQVAELRHQIAAHADPPVVLVGWSWGGMLATIMAAKQPEAVAKLVLVGPSSFDDAEAAAIMPERLRRLSGADRERVAELSGAGDDASLVELGRIVEGADAYDPLPEDDEQVEVSAAIYRAVWNEAVALRRSGEMLALAARVTCPFTVIHGDYDPHPVSAISSVPNVRIVTLARCGHMPWRERQAREEFFRVLRETME